MNEILLEADRLEAQGNPLGLLLRFRRAIEPYAKHNYDHLGYLDYPCYLSDGNGGGNGYGGEDGNGNGGGNRHCAANGDGLGSGSLSHVNAGFSKSGV